MKTMTHWTGIKFTAALVLVLGLTACSSVGYKTGDRTSARLHEASQAVELETQALDDTIASLSTLVNSPAADLKPQFLAYRESLDRLMDSVERTDKAIARLQNASAEYLAAWDAQLAEMNYEVIRSTSEMRKLSVSNRIAAICQRHQEAHAVVSPFISYFSDIQRSLGTDLTTEGLAAAREVVANAETNTRKVQAALKDLSNELSNSSARLASINWEQPLEATGRSDGNARADAELKTE